jgi:hydroxybutyrate-dimer hydrolase
MIHRLASLAILLVLAFDIVACRAEAPVPSWLHEGARTHLDGQSDDLVTAGLGAEALLNTVPVYADPAYPTVIELRRAAIFFKGSAGQGFGRLYGPNINQETGKLYPDGGKIAGDEILAFDDDGSGRQNVAMSLQIPVNLSNERRCLVAIPVNGSARLFRDVVDFGFCRIYRQGAR